MSNFSDMDNVFIMDHPLIQHKDFYSPQQRDGNK